VPTTTDSTTRTAHLLALMKKGDDAFNAPRLPSHHLTIAIHRSRRRLNRD
jgi:hypothetical protein